jgi:lipoprotein-anchoring transpeptidase ErfK/SrfK
MTFVSFRAALGISLIAGLSACVPTTPTTSEATKSAAALPAEATPPVEKNAALYVGTSDNGFAVLTVPVEKVPDEFERQEVDFPTDEPPGTIIINPGAKHLFFITGKNKAIRYGVSVGRAGFEWAGEANITNRKSWPTWTPPKEMIERSPELSKWEKGQPGGPSNPLGARALYLTTNGRDYGYRIHGTPEWWSIGRNASSGCIRMINQDVMDLYNRVPDGAKVIVLNRDGSMPKGLVLPPPQPKKKAPAPQPAVAPAVATPVETTVPPTPVVGTVTPAPTVGLAPVTEGAAATPAVPAAVTAPIATTQPSVTVPETPATPAPVVVAPLTTAPAAPSLSGVEPSPVVATTPTAVTTPSITPAAPTATAPVCAVPLVNGLCPQG